MQSFQGKGGRLKLSSYLQPFIPKNPVFYQKKRRKLLNKQHISLENLTFTHSLVMFIPMTINEFLKEKRKKKIVRRSKNPVWYTWNSHHHHRQVRS
jgi:hypothetical protein